MDIIQKLGPLAFASRLKRISEGLMRDVSQIYRELDVDFQARWFPVMYLLGQKSPLAVTEIAKELNMTHPAINQIAAAMTRAGLMESTRDTRDERRRLLSISKEGGRVMKKLVPVWKDIEAATRQVLDESGPDTLALLDRIETALREKSMYRRVTARTKRRQYDAVEIIEYEPKLRKEFERLNTAWLKKYFTVEAYDKALMSDPRRRIVNKGGFIIFARLDGEIAGTVAVLRHDDGTMELAKMAVDEKWQGKQIGKRLACAVIERIASAGHDELILYTNPILVAANNLYRKLGFVEIKEASPTKFERFSIKMSLNLKSKPYQKIGSCHEKQ